MAAKTKTEDKTKETEKTTAKKAGSLKKKTAAKKTTTKKAATKKSSTKSSTAKKGASSKKAAAKKTTSKAGNNKQKSLIIVESPAKARTLERYSQGRYHVLASMGHVRDLPKSSIGVDLENQYNPKYITIRGKKTVIDALKKGAKQAKQVFLASDPDREGEAIAWHLANLLKVENPRRIEMHEITKDALNAALENPRDIDIDRVNAQQARRILDRLVGYNLSPLLWRKITSGLSAGRVQSVAVKLICDRQREIDAFEPQEYWLIGALTSKLNKPKKDAFEASLLKVKNKKPEIPDKKTADEILESLRNSQFVVKTVVIKEQKRNPMAPFRTSTLQQEAYRKLGFRASRTMSIAQQLYEGIDVGGGATGLITYMRTDSVRISNAARAEADQFIKETYGKEYAGAFRKYSTKGKTQDAHEAVRPTSVYRTPEMMKSFLKRDQLRLYKLIWERFVASQMAACIMEVTTVDITAGDCIFRAGDSRVKFPGFTKIYDSNGDKEKENNSPFPIRKKAPLPVLEEGEELKVHEFIPEQKFTQPPPAYTEASLIKTLEEKGIGRPSTYAPIVETIQKRGYTVIEAKKFRPTELGFKVNDMLQEHFPDILNVDFTAGLENKLDKIEEGAEDWVEVIDKFYRPFSVTLVEADKKIPKVDLEPEMTDEVCEKCGKPMVIKRGRFGKFMACSGYPECKNTKPILKEIGVPCPEEGCDGQIVERRARKGTFYGCSNYPNCKFASWYKPLNERCSRCGKLLTLRFSRAGRGYKACIDSACQKEKQKEKKENKEGSE